MTTDNLPPLPFPVGEIAYRREMEESRVSNDEAYDSDQMKSYARLAVRQALEKLVEEYDKDQMSLTRNFKISDRVREIAKDYE